jgi:hypothetical protein
MPALDGVKERMADGGGLMKRSTVATVVAGMWIGASEFLRNELLFKGYWTDHYAGLGLAFPSEMVNNALWGVWSFLLAGCVVFLARRLKSFETLAVVWVMAFAMMWVVTGNLAVLPLGLLIFAVPWSLAETAVALWIARRLAGSRVPRSGVTPG